MFLQISTTQPIGRDLGYLLHKHPDRVHETDLGIGRAVMAYPRADEEGCTFVMILDLDPVALVRGQGKAPGLVDQYVNDRPYVASSFLSSALSKALGSALNGRSRERPELAAAAIPLEAVVAPLPVRGGDGLVRRLFEPLGWKVDLERHPLLADDPTWGQSRYVTLSLKGTMRLADMLGQIYVLVPVLDDEKHYWISEDEIGKLLDKGSTWLVSHPERETITRRYLSRKRLYAETALALLSEGESDEKEEAPAGRAAEAAGSEVEETLERPARLYEQRYEAVLSVLRETGASVVADLGCAEGKFLGRLARDPGIRRIIGLDASSLALKRAEERVARLPEKLRGKVELLHGALTYRDRRLEGLDAALLIEVIEHVDPERLRLLEDAIFGAARPDRIVVTTPNREHNSVFGLAEGELRHPDHRFEWTRAEFGEWAGDVAGRLGWAVEFAAIGVDHPEFGPPTQMAVFSRAEKGAGDVQA